jgi:hypothetical protein
MSDDEYQQWRLFDLPPDDDDIIEPSTPVAKQQPIRVIPLELRRASQDRSLMASSEEIVLPARWEEVQAEAEVRQVFSVIVQKLIDVPALDHLAKLTQQSSSEGYVWVVLGKSGSGKSAFFQTLEYRFQGSIKTLIINESMVGFSNPTLLSDYLKEQIRNHHLKNGTEMPLVVVLEGREQRMTQDERSSIAQALRNVLRYPGPGKHVIFVLPVTNSNHGNLFLNELGKQV